MGSSGEMATAEQMKGERVGCSNTALRVGQMEQLLQTELLACPLVLGGCVFACRCLLCRLMGSEGRQAGGGAGLSRCHPESRAWRLSVSVTQGQCWGSLEAAGV